MEIQPYLFFDGRCEEAIAFYREALGAQELMKMRFKDAPASNDYQTSPELADKIMHAALAIGSTHLLMSDGQAGEKETVHSGFSLSVTVNDVASGEKHFKATLNKYRRRHQPCLFAGHRGVGEGRLAVCRDGGPKACGQTGLAPTC
ncbi:VOC family protein [Dyella sp.]|jgi:PhnB protein|uniref:VOC family protein n=1 Tax=Dyella sp. TaxID=1869338 RepID=UPI002FDB67DD